MLLRLSNIHFLILTRNQDMTYRSEPSLWVSHYHSFLPRYSIDLSKSAAECLSLNSIGIELFLLRSEKGKGNSKWDLNRFSEVHDQIVL
jgi:hypothetical protein